LGSNPIDNNFHIPEQPVIEQAVASVPAIVDQTPQILPPESFDALKDKDAIEYIGKGIDELRSRTLNERYGVAA